MATGGAGPDGSELSEGLGLLPITRHDHPEPQTMVWSDIELQAIRAYAGRCVAAERERSAKIAEDRLHQMTADRAQSLRWRDQLDRALTVCRCAGRVIDSSAYQGVSDEYCDLEVAVRNWRDLGPNVRAKPATTAGKEHKDGTD